MRSGSSTSSAACAATSRRSSAELEGAEARLHDAQVSVTAEVARTYFELRGEQTELAVARRNVDNQTRNARPHQARLDAGRGTEFDTSRAQAQLRHDARDHRSARGRRGALDPSPRRADGPGAECARRAAAHRRRICRRCRSMAAGRRSGRLAAPPPGHPHRGAPARRRPPRASASRSPISFPRSPSPAASATPRPSVGASGRSRRAAATLIGPGSPGPPSISAGCRHAVAGQPRAQRRRACDLRADACCGRWRKPRTRSSPTPGRATA